MVPGHEGTGLGSGAWEGAGARPAPRHPWCCSHLGLISPAPRLGSRSSRGVVEPSGAGRGERSFSAPSPSPATAGDTPPARRSPRLRPGLLPFTLDPQPRRCGPGSRPQRVPALGRGLGALVVTPSGLSVAAASVLCHRRQLGLCAERAALFPAPVRGGAPLPHRQVVTPANQPVTRWRDHLPLGLPASWPEEPEVMWIGRQAPGQLLGVPGWGALPPSLGSSEQG